MTRLREPTDALRQHIREMAAAARAADIARLNERELAFHQTLCDLSRNRHVATLFRSISAQVQIALALDNAAAMERLTDYIDPLEVARAHEPLVEVIERGDEDQAAHLLVEHIVSSVESWLETLPPEISGASQNARKRLLRPGA